MTESRLPYGPNSMLVRRFLQRLAALGVASEQQVVTTYETVTKRTEFWDADSAVAILVAKAGRQTDRDAMAGPLLQLAASKVGSDASAAREAEPLRPIAEPALAALLALMMADLLEPDHFKVLYESFEQTIPFESLK